MGALLSLLSSFPPADWSEEQFINAPPFILENGSGKVFATATGRGTEAILDVLPRSLGLKKRRQGKVHYLITKSASVKAFRQFFWFVRRSWRSGDFAVLWAVVRMRAAKDWSEALITLDAVAEASGRNRKECEEILKRLGDWSFGQGRTGGFSVGQRDAEMALKKLLSELPNWTEELIMQTLCSGIGGSASEVYERVVVHGIGMSATYKTLEKLKRTGYLFPLKHYRVSQRGPMRELLAANCRTCFYGYASPERCLSDTLRQVEDRLEVYYGKKLTAEEKENLHSSIRAVPYSSRLVRRVDELLRLMHEADRITKEGGVQTIIGKISEGYGEEFPLKAR